MECQPPLVDNRDYAFQQDEFNYNKEQDANCTAKRGEMFPALWYSFFNNKTKRGWVHVNEWTIVGVLISLVGFVAVFMKATYSLTSSMTSLDVTLKSLKESIDKEHQENLSDHKEIWDKENEQDRQINNHETRITVLESKGKDEP